MSTSPSSAASASMAPPSRTSRTRPSTRAPAVGGGSRRGADAVGVAAGEQDAVRRVHAGGERFDERAAEALVGPRDEGGASVCHASTVVPRETCGSEYRARYHAFHACLAISPNRPAGPARGRAAGSFSAAASALGLHAVGGLSTGRGARGRRRPALFERRRDGVVLTPAGAGCCRGRCRPRELDAALATREPVSRPGRAPGRSPSRRRGSLPRRLATLPPN